MDTVVIEKCAEYDLHDVKQKILHGLDTLGGLDAFIKPDEKVLIKVNSLNGSGPSRAANTHPVFLQAVIQLVKTKTSHIVIADSPGITSFLTAAKGNGIWDVIREERVDFVEFSEDDEIETPEPLLYRHFKVDGIVKRVDKIINLPKLKTHALVMMTLCVKNMFGIIPERRKAEYHLKAGRDAEIFAKMLVDLYRAKPPTLNIVDGIVAMEGNGPGNGNPINLGVIVLGVNGFAVDRVICDIVNIDPHAVLTNAVYSKYVLKGKGMDIELKGASIADVKRKDFKPVHGTFSRLPKFASGLFRNMLSPRQVYIRKKCTHCMICTKECPVKCLKFDKAKGIVCDYHACIKCFVCQEMCPAKAIEIRKPLLSVFGKNMHSD